MNELFYSAIERRIEIFMLGLGAAAALAAGIGSGKHAAIGALAGAALCWLNFRWIRRGARALERVGRAQAALEKVRVPTWLYGKFVGRYVLLLAAVYVILTRLQLPVVAFLCGLVAVVPAILLELVYELLRRYHRPDML